MDPSGVLLRPLALTPITSLMLNRTRAIQNCDTDPAPNPQLTTHRAEQKIMFSTVHHLDAGSLVSGITCGIELLAILCKRV